MQHIKHHDPARMTPEQRRQEVAFILAEGLIRVRNLGATPAIGSFSLGFSGDQRVHANPNDPNVQEVS